MNDQPPRTGARGIFTTLVRSWALILGITVAAALGALGYCWLQQPVYKANATVYVTSGTSSMSSAWDGVKSSQDRVATYARLVYSDAVLAPALDEAGLDVPLQPAREQVQVEVDPQITTMTISATDHDPVVAQRLANAISDSLADAVSTLDVPSGGGAPAARVTVINTAQVEPDPVWPKPLITIPVAAVVGLIVGLLLALVLERLNNRVRDEKDAEVALDAASLGSVPPADDMIIDFESDTGAVAEAFRGLRTSFLASAEGSNTRRLVVTSAQPAAEKSTVAINLAGALAHAGNQVVAVDADLIDRYLSRITGVRNEAGLSDVLAGRSNIDGVLMPTKSDNLAVVGAGSKVTNGTTDLLASKEFHRLLTELSGRFDYVIVDCAAALGNNDAVAAAASADGVMVVTWRKSKLSDLRRVRDRLADVKASVVGIVYCESTPSPEPKDTEPPIEDRRRGADEDQTKRARTAHRV